MFDSFRSRLLVILLSFACCILLAAVLTFKYYSDHKSSLEAVTDKIAQTHVLLLKDIKIIHDFFENETINPDFFRSRKSALLVQHQELCEKVHNSTTELYDLQKEHGFDLGDSLSAFTFKMSNYARQMDVMVSKILERGYKNYGTEGKMREFVHELEKFENEAGLVSVLQMRRHEKDFIIRQEQRYVDLHREVLEKLRSEVRLKAVIPQPRKQKILELLDNYQEQFNLLVQADKSLGLKSGGGLKRKIDELSNNLELSVSALLVSSRQQETTIKNNIRLVLIIMGLIFIAASVVFARIISRRFSRSIILLTEKIDEFVKSDFSKRTILPINDSKNEIDVLTTNFSIMEQHIVDQMQSLKQTNKDLEMLFYATSHDIQNPLLEVRELTEQALKYTTDAHAKKYLAKINSQWSQLLTIIDELGIITNVRNVEIEVELIDLESLIKSVFAEFKLLPWFDNIIFSMEIKLQRKLYSSRSLLKIIFRNLIENGIKYATKRSSFSFLRISVLSEEDNRVRILFSDNGIGIKKEFQDKIFDMFFRGTTYTSGTGLGLYIVQNSLEKLNGAITVESDENSGTTFTILIPNEYKRKKAMDKIREKKQQDLRA